MKTKNQNKNIIAGSASPSSFRRIPKMDPVLNQQKIFKIKIYYAPIINGEIFFSILDVQI
jgi:hypothetical protein